MWHFFDKRATVVDVTDKEVIGLFQDGLYHHRTFEDFGRRRPSSITKLKDLITSWADEEDKANAKYDAIRGKSKKNPVGSNNNNRDQGGRNNNNYSGPNSKRKADNTVTVLTVNSYIEFRLDLQADKSPIVVKGPFFPRVVNPRYRIRGTNV
jgi:hypothetical protein